MSKKYFFLFFFFIFVLVAKDVIATESKAGEIQTKKFVIENGLTVLISEMPSSSTVSIFGLVKTGSATEGKYMGTGISHFLEHMLFKGTDKRGVGQISKEVQALGGEINASTSFDYTIYTLTVPQGAFDQGLDIISDMLTKSKFDPQEIDKEREVVYSEMQLHKDNPDRHLSQMVFDTVFKQHPYGIPIIGYEELLRSLKREDFVDYYKTHYIPNNMVLSIAGKVQSQEILPKIREIFKDFSRQRIVLRNLAPEPMQINMRSAVEEYPTDLTRLSLAFSGVSLREPDMFAMDVLAMILGQGESSRLYKQLIVNKKIVRTINASNFTPLDRGVFEVEMVLDEANVEKAISITRDQIREIAKLGVEVSELDKIKRQVLSTHVFSLLTSDGVANNSAFDEAFLGDFDFSRKYVAAIKKISVDDIKRVARQYFSDDQLSVVILKPQKPAAEVQPTKSIEQNLEIQKFVLENGLTILLRENHASPIVSMNVVINGGTWQETAQNNGVSDLTARLITSGTKTRSSEEIAQSVEARGMRLSPFSGRNSFGFSFNLLSEDKDFALDLMEDFIKNPNFPPEELTGHKKDVSTALMRQEDNIRTISARSLRELLFLAHPFRMDSLGRLDNVENISRTDIMDFFKKHVAPNNMVISVFGDIDSSKILAALKSKFSGLAKRKVDILTYTENPPDQTREKIMNLNKKQAMVMLGFQGVDLKSEDRYAMQVLSSILGSSFSGRIFTTIRDVFGEAYTLGGGFTPSRDMGMISFFVQTTDESVLKVKDLLIKIIDDVRRDGVDLQELEDMKKYIKGSFAMGIETDSSLGFICALDELYGNGYDNYQSFDRKIDAVTQDDIKRLAIKYLDLNKATIVITRPNNQVQEKSAVHQPSIMSTGPSDIH